MDYSKFIVVVLVLVPFFAQTFKENLIKSDHSNCFQHALLTASHRLQAHKEHVLTERACWKQIACLEMTTIL